FGLYIANLYGWNMPFYWIAAMGVLIALSIVIYLKPLTEHLSLQSDHTAFRHLMNTFGQKNYRIGFLTTALLSIGGFMMMPFGSAFAINNLKITNQQLPILFMITGIATLVIM